MTTFFLRNGVRIRHRIWHRFARRLLPVVFIHEFMDEETWILGSALVHWCGVCNILAYYDSSDTPPSVPASYLKQKGSLGPDGR